MKSLRGCLVIMVKLEILGDRLLVEVEAARKETESGIILADGSVSKSQIGKVVSVGTGRFTESGKNIPVAVNVGDKILFDKFAGDPIVIEDKEYLLLNENNVIGIIR